MLVIMPYKIEKIKLPKELDRRIKLNDQQRDEIKINIEWLSQNKLAKKYKVDRKLIRFIQFPEVLEAHKTAYAKRRKDWRYYNKEKNKEAIKKTRIYKHNLWYEKLLSMQNVD